METSAELRQGLSQRQLNMIAIGGVVGAGLFVGSGFVISATGPGAFLTYALCGALMILVMRMLGEMATANPSTGSFADYARQALGGWAGFSVGWLYWYFWVVVVGFEAVAGGKIITYWFNAPLWLLSLILLVTMTATNLFSVSSFGEFEFWFSAVKIATVVAFLALGAAFVLGLWPHRHLDFSNLTSHGGFFPKGVGAVFAAIALVVPSMVGAEVATIAAAETSDPARAVRRATNSVVARIAIFFVGSVFLLAVIQQWNAREVSLSPYVAAFKTMGLPAADHIMNAVVLTAVLSCLNSGLYTASRMLFVLAARREAPCQLVKVGRRGVPYTAILSSSVGGFVCVLMAWVAPRTVLPFLLNSAGALVLSIYLLIALSQIVLRRRTPPENLQVKMWFFPVLSIITVAGIVGALVLMAFERLVRIQLWLGLVSWSVVITLYFVGKSRRRPVEREPEQPPTGAANRVLVLANQTLSAAELFDELRRVDAERGAEYFVCVPANPIDTGQAEIGAVYVRNATMQAAQQRLDDMLSAMREIGLRADGALGDFRPWCALAGAVDTFQPDQLVISTLPVEQSAWLRDGLIARACSTYSIPIHHVVASAPALGLAR
ncbi:MAG: amino acid permease [Mycobacterium sp.]|uniref:amino acid permease n=1 Tax=Mycobacterium sp. TaxID=1785 RepID=UPI003CC5F74A